MFRQLFVVVLGLILQVFANLAAGQTPRSSSGTRQPLPDHRKAGWAPTRMPDKSAQHPRFALGLGAGIPEIAVVEGLVWFNSYLGMRLYAVPPVPFNIRIEMPAEVISTKKDVGVANPDYNINLKAAYGPQVGFDLKAFPFAGSWHLFAGLGYQEFDLRGQARSPILICGVAEAIKEPPCGDSTARLQTKTELELKAHLHSSAFTMRAGLGWDWVIADTVYIRAVAGMMQPFGIKSKIDVTAGVEAPGFSGDDAVQGALGEVKREKEADLELRAKQQVAPYLEKRLPIVGLSAGYVF